MSKWRKAFLWAETIQSRGKACQEKLADYTGKVTLLYRYSLLRAATIGDHRRPSYEVGLSKQLPATSYFSGFGVAFAATSPKMYCMPARKCPTISGRMN